jgi:hypothetical protein
VGGRWWAGISLVVACVVLGAPALTGAPALVGTTTLASTVQSVFWVSPDPANPTASCASMAEACSLGQAQQDVRAVDGHMTGDIDVELSGGDYHLSRTLALGPQDSGTDGYDVVYQAAPGAQPVLSGGEAVTGWQPVPGTAATWQAPLPAGVDDTAQLYLSGSPLPVSQGLPADTEFVQTPAGFETSSTALDSYADPSDIEAVFTGGNGPWTQTWCPIASISGETVTMAQPCWGNLHLPAEGVQEVAWVDGPQGGFGGLLPTSQPSYLANAYNLLTPGSWCIDRSTHTLFYMSEPGQDVTALDFEVPALQTLVSVTGTPASPAHDVVLKGIGFAYGTYTGADDDDGFAQMQADWTLTGPDAAASEGTCQYSIPAGTCPYASWTRLPANVVLDAARDVELVGDTFSKLGGAGLDISNGSQDDLVEGNTFDDIAASAIQLGATDDPHPSDVGAGSDEIVYGNTIEDNYITDVANRYLGGVGIWVGYTQHTTIAHNQLDDLPYTAISMGWGGWHASWLDPDADLNVNAHNVISDNLMFDYMTTLGDGGAIYTNGSQADSFADALVEEGNVAYDGVNTDFSLYTDAASQYVDVAGNVIYDQPEDSFATGGCHTVGHIRITDNWFSVLGPAYPCDVAVDVVTTGTHLVCSQIQPGQVPDTVLGTAGLEPQWQFLLLGTAPEVTGVGPSSVGTDGATVLVSGSGFTASTTVSFGAQPATSVQVLSANYLLSGVPPGTSGSSADVIVHDSAGTSSPSASVAVSWSSHPSPCLPIDSGNFSTGLLK